MTLGAVCKLVSPYKLQLCLLLLLLLLLFPV
jgi:hypothetical protein